ncbi:MAG: YihA family ribosome biogenesis GTP-binding protein [Peptococcaceae bacterium]|nr:YihA family ribosome biogenesis GTP-binding protein [Peptococcaceae bacterium]
MKIVSADFVKSAYSIKDCPEGDLPEVALAGRSNVGKSSFLNKIVNRKGLARTSNTPGRTRLINFFLINNAFSLVDLPGYGYARVPMKMKLEWGVLIQEYLKKRNLLRGVVILLDIRHQPTEMDVQFYSWLKKEGIPVLLVTTKVDKLSRGQVHNQMKLIEKTMGVEDQKKIIGFSSKTGQGLEAVWEAIEKLVG